jgi:anti-sigma B factor antagonist
MNHTSSPSLAVQLRREPNVLLVDVEGELDLDGAPELCAAIGNGERSRDRRHVLVDLSRVTFCDSTGLKALMDAAREVAVAGGRLIVVVPEDGSVRKVMALTGAAEFLHVTSDRGQVLSAVRGTAGQPAKNVNAVPTEGNS